MVAERLAGVLSIPRSVMLSVQEVAVQEVDRETGNMLAVSEIRECWQSCWKRRFRDGCQRRRRFGGNLTHLGSDAVVSPECGGVVSVCCQRALSGPEATAMAGDLRDAALPSAPK